MKKLLFIFLITFLGKGFSAAQVQNDSIKLQWETSFKNALKKSKKEKKPILIYFTGSDWCGPCQILDRKLFLTKKFKNFADQKLILYKVDVPRNKDLVPPSIRKVNNKLIKKYKQKSFPTIVMVNHLGKPIGVKKGLYMVEYYFPFFQSVVAKY